MTDPMFFRSVAAMRQALAEQGNKPAALASIGEYLLDPDVRREWFHNLNDAAWIAPLRAEGYFGNVPSPRALEGGGVQHPRWPEGEYLARMASAAPSEVVSVLANIRVDNVTVVRNVVAAALAMPAFDAAKLVPAMSRAALAGTLWIHFKDASDACVRLATEGEVHAAIALADALFAPRIGEGEEQVNGRDQFWYNEGLKKVVPVLAELQPREFIRHLGAWLDALISTREGVKSGSGDDFSYWWRPAVEEHEQNLDHDLTGALVGFLRHALEHAVKNNTLSLAQALEIIAPSRFMIFRRIRVHLVGEFADSDPTLARQTMMSHDLFDDFRYKHEYARLVGLRLGMLSSDERDTWFSWVEAGPDMSSFEESIREEFRRAPTKEERLDRKEYWQLEKLHCVRAHLEGAWRALYDRTLAKHGEPELADLNVRTSSRWGGGGGAVTVEELSTLTFEGAVDFVSSWVPPGDHTLGPDLEGLASAFGEFVEKRAEESSKKASVLIRRQAAYVRTFIGQMTRAIKADRAVDLPAILELCRWVIAQPQDEPERSGESQRLDQDWQWTRDEISRLAQAVFQAKADGRPRYSLEFRVWMWEVVDALAHDRAGSSILHDTAQDDPRAIDYLNLAINSPRGRGVDAVLEYARWIASHTRTSDKERPVVSGGFALMPEVRELLTWQISAEHRTIEALAVVGSRIGLIHWIDRGWLATNVEQLFDLEGIDASPPRIRGWAAWNAFLVWVRPYVEYYRLFRKQYAFAVDQAAVTDLGQAARGSPMGRLGEHLAILYGRGDLSLDDEGGLLRRFLTHAKPDIRRHAIEFVGQVLHHEPTLPQDFVVRYQQLWDAYWAGEGRADAQQKPDGLLFGLWFSSGRFDPGWGIARLRDFVEVVPVPEPSHQVVEKLAKVASNDVSSAVEILERMVRGDEDGWHIGMWMDSAKTILEEAMRVGGEVRAQAERLIDHLGRRGYTTVGELLNIGSNA